jgi:hypothetical protein
MTMLIKNNDNAAVKTAAATMLLLAANDQRHPKMNKRLRRKGKISERGNGNLAKMKSYRFNKQLQRKEE